ncbi:WD40 repeat-like protein [Macroventuria anomochaeta]|uniref:WD40 repeat-like protein n=1 Tax=Macroventuria anomochaeta TaxID=301207 RepID=A0ACB6RLI1_9PLEO|nr:WD40 repeat-like protein [Macroventuria anomochaeta]KAF2622866.1 WD40 repeat-like protein [Macroventuria anomochaeta]
MNEDDYDDNGASSAEEEDEQEENDAMDVDEDEGGDDDDDGDNDDEDAEGDNDDDDDQDQDGDNDNDNDNDEEQDEPGSPSQRRRSLPNGGTPGPSDSNPRVTRTSPSPQAAATGVLGHLPLRPSVRQEALDAPVYDIIPTIAAPHSTSINAITATPDMRWVFSGGADGYIRKFNWIDTANGKLALTVAQRHPFVDSVTKAGVLLSYWENEDGAGSDAPSPVYSLAVHHQSLWLLSGTESGGINLQSVRHNEGHRIHTLKGHTSAVSVLTLGQDETSVLSGSWDKTINDWDLNTGKVKRRFETRGGQVSAIEQRPLSSLPVPQDSDPLPLSNGTFSSNNAARPRLNGSTNGIESAARTTSAPDEPEDAPGSPDDSLFGDGGDKDSLFGDGGGNNPSAALPDMGDDDDDEFSRAIANGIQAAADNAGGDMDMMDMGGPVQAPDAHTHAETQPTHNASAKSPPAASQTQPSNSAPLTNGLPHAEELPAVVKDTPSLPPSSESTFLSSSMDGSLSIWDRRQPSPIARLLPPRGTPPWCMNACWSPDGNYIYAGRRNGTVDEYSLHKTLSQPERTFKFPGVSGSVSAVRAMPNGRTLIWYAPPHSLPLPSSPHYLSLPSYPLFSVNTIPTHRNSASYDILRQYDLTHTTNSSIGADAKQNTAATPFLIVPGHRTGVISQLYLDPTCTFMISTGGNRGWEGASTEVLLGYEISYGA